MIFHCSFSEIRPHIQISNWPKRRYHGLTIEGDVSKRRLHNAKPRLRAKYDLHNTTPRHHPKPHPITPLRAWLRKGVNETSNILTESFFNDFELFILRNPSSYSYLTLAITATSRDITFIPNSLRQWTFYTFGIILSSGTNRNVPPSSIEYTKNVKGI